MEAIDKLRLDFREGRLDVERLFDVIVTLQRQLESAKQRIEELEKKLGGPATAKVNEAFSVRAEEKRQEARLKRKKRKPAHKSRRGRVTTEEKLKLAQRTEDCFPEGVPEQDCHLSHTRPVWRLENGRTVLIAYQIYRGPKNQYGKIPGVLGRSEIGLEIVVEIAYLVYVTGLRAVRALRLDSQIPYSAVRVARDSGNSWRRPGKGGTAKSGSHGRIRLRADDGSSRKDCCGDS